MDFAGLLKDLIIIVLIPTGRSVSGWAVNALKDNKVTKFEWKQLVSTVLRVGTMALMVYFGLAAVSVDNAAVIGADSAFLADKLFSLASKFLKKK